MRKLIGILLLTTLSAGAANAQSMPVSTFLAKADALKKKGAMALFSSDINLLKKEGMNSAAALRAERLQAIKAGKKPAFCPPEKGGSLNSGELLTHLQSIPAPQRSRMPMKEASKA